MHPRCTRSDFGFIFVIDIKCLYPLPSNLLFDAAQYLIHNGIDFLLSVNPVTFKLCVKLAASHKDLTLDFEARQIPGLDMIS